MPEFSAEFDENGSKVQIDKTHTNGTRKGKRQTEQHLIKEENTVKSCQSTIANDENDMIDLDILGPIFNFC